MNSEIVLSADVVESINEIHVVCREPVSRAITQFSFDQQPGEEFVATASRAIEYIKENKLELLDIRSTRKTTITVKEEHDALVEQTLKVL